MGTLIATHWIDLRYCLHCSKYMSNGPDKDPSYLVAIARGNGDKFDTITTLEGPNLLDLVYKARIKYERKHKRWDSYYDAKSRS